MQIDRLCSYIIGLCDKELMLTDERKLIQIYPIKHPLNFPKLKEEEERLLGRSHGSNLYKSSSAMMGAGRGEEESFLVR